MEACITSGAKVMLLCMVPPSIRPKISLHTLLSFYVRSCLTCSKLEKMLMFDRQTVGVGLSHIRQKAFHWIQKEREKGLFIEKAARFAGVCSRLHASLLRTGGKNKKNYYYGLGVITYLNAFGRFQLTWWEKGLLNLCRGGLHYTCQI